MATGAEFVRAALRELGINSSDSEISGQEMLDGIESLNDMLSEWENSGRVLGFSPIASPSDVVRVPRGTEYAIKANLAGRIAPQYSKQISISLAETIDSSTRNLLKIIAKPLDVAYPNTLPIGSGNECDGYDEFTDHRFFNGSILGNF